MRLTWVIMSLMLLLSAAKLMANQNCIPRKELMDRHVVTYQAYNGTTRGCEVNPNFYTQQHKMGRGRLSRKFIINICEGEPRTSPRIGDSFQICPYIPKPKPLEKPSD